MLEYPEEDKLGRAHRRDTDLADQAAVEDVILRHRRLVAFDEARLVLGAPEQRAKTPLAAQTGSFLQREQRATQRLKGCALLSSWLDGHRSRRCPHP